MPLDPHVKGLLDMLVAAGRPKTWQVTPPEAREGMNALAQAVDIKDVPIGKIENGTLPGPAGAIPYRLYTPADAAGAALAGLVYFHGGGFVIGNLDSHDGMCRVLANESGCRVVSIDYRLAPEHKFPAAVDDCFAATKWVADNAAKLGIDRSRLAIGGDSAGGNLAAVIAQLAARAGGPKLKLQVLFCPATDQVETESRRAYGEGYLLEQKSMEWFFAHYVPANIDPNDPRLNPLRATDLSGLPPAHIHTAEFDPLRDEGKAYADKLAQAGVRVSYTCHEGLVHHFYAMAGIIPKSLAALKTAGAAIRQALA